MSKLAVVRRQATIGTHVTLRLSRGEDVSGHITEIDDEYVCLDLGEKTITIFDDILAGFEVHRGGRPDNEVEEPRDLTPPLGPIVNESTSPGEQLPESHAEPILSSITTDSDVLVILAKIRAVYSEALKRARLHPLDPDFEFPKDQFLPGTIDSVRREWDRARNQYEYALKIKELNRISNIVAQVLTPLSTRHPDSAAVRSLLGRMLLKTDRQSEARDHLKDAAKLSDQPDHWLALASAAVDGTALECYALRRYFSLEHPWNAQEEWYRYLAVAIDHGDWRGVTKVIQDCFQSQRMNGEQRTLLSESITYLSSLGKESQVPLLTAKLARASGELPPTWIDEFNHRSSPSDDLLAVEREFSRPLISPALSPPPPLGLPVGGDVSHGSITSFGNQRFGFISAPGDRQFFFRIDDVADDGLRQVLLDGTWKNLADVEFDVLPAGHHRYPRAANIVRLHSDALLLRARDLMQTGQYPQAMGIVRRVLRSDSINEYALQLEQKIKQLINRHGIGLPRGKGPYASAKRAHLIDHDLDRAEGLLKQAIRDNDNTESAVKDLASLLQQKERTEEAIILLEGHSRDSKGVSPYDNMLATQYQHAGHHDDAIKILARLARATSWPKKGPLLRRIAVSYFKCAKYDDAERELRKILIDNPSDLTAARWLNKLEEARQAGSYDDVEETIESDQRLSEEGIELSSIAVAAIDSCTYEGVDAARLQAGDVGGKDVERVEELAKQLGTGRPRDRAAYYLSAAALLKRTHGDFERICDYMRRHFASMAAASSIEKKAADVVRSYWVESLALVIDNTLGEAWRSLLRYLSTFSPKKLNDAEAMRDISRKKYINALRKMLAMINPDDDVAWLEGLLVLGSQSSFARDRIGNAIRDDPVLATTFAKLLESTNGTTIAVQATWQSKCREHAHAYRNRLDLCRTLTNYQATVASMEGLGEQLRNALMATASELDRARLKAVSDIAGSALAFCRATDFEEKERNYWMVTTQVDSIRKEITNAPTRYSHEGLLSVADHLSSLIEEEYAQTAQTSGADLSLHLPVDEYYRTNDGELRLQIEVANRPGCSPASSVQISLGPMDSEYFSADRWEREAAPTLRGGESVVTHMAVRPKPVALKGRAFPINVTAIYRSRLGEDRRTHPYAWTVRLYRDEDFEYIKNPYAPFAEGGPVDDPDMFVGRDDLLSRLESSLLAASGSKSIVMFGQKRAGKSSLLEHLRQRLSQNGGIVPVCFSLQEVAPELSVKGLLYRLLQGIAEVLDELRASRADLPDFSPPDIDALESHAVLRFHEAMASLLRAMNRTASCPRIVLLVDEFTDIFKEIRNDRIPRQFMKAWKSIIEKKYFASVLVGQDIMPAFKDEFPNEFGVTEDVRVTYLDDVAATTLVQQPIGKDRFVGNAVMRLLDLTARSPYYTMMFCARLVDYMNDTRSAIVTEADITTVKDRMLTGDRRLTRDKFDNLLCAGDGKADSGIDPDDTYAVCAAIARGSERGWCSREQITDLNGSLDIDALLSDLDRRDVVECKGTAYRLRVGLFHDWLRRQGRYNAV